MFLHLVPIAAAGVVSATIITERTSKLFFQYSIDSRLFLSQIEGFMQKGDLQSALNLCDANEKKLLPRVVKSALLKAARDDDTIKTALGVSVMDASGLLTARIGYLAMIANVATLLGLLGTIAGLIQSFKAVASADAATKQSLLADGISVSMNATALGLVVAIPTMIAFSILNGRANKILDDLEKGAGRVLTLLHGRMYAGDDDFSNVRMDGADAANINAAGNAPASNGNAAGVKGLKGAA